MKEESKLSKNIKNSLNELLNKAGVDPNTKIFGSPVSDFDLEDMSIDQLRSMKRLLLIKLNKLENNPEITIL